MENKLTIISEGQIEDILKKTIDKAVKDSYSDLEKIILSNQYYTKEEVLKMTGWSERTLQNLRDTKQITYSQHGRKILYPVKGILEFLDRNTVTPNSNSVKK